MSVTKETPVSAPPRRCIRIVVFFMLQTKGEQTCSPALQMHAREGAVLTARCTRGARSCTDGLLVFSEVFSALAIGISWWILVRRAFKPPEVINFSLVVFFPPTSFSFTSMPRPLIMALLWLSWPALLLTHSPPSSWTLDTQPSARALSPCLHCRASPHSRLPYLVHWILCVSYQWHILNPSSNFFF